MSTFRRFSTACLALFLAACGSSPATEPAAAPEAPAALKEAAPAPTTIPAPFVGRWGLTLADCIAVPRREGILEIAAAELRFYESRARLGGDVQVTEQGIAADFEFQGEGETWVRRLQFELGEGGRTLVRRDGNDTPEQQATLYHRCPA